MYNIDESWKCILLKEPDEGDDDAGDVPAVWVHRVESMTQELQRSNKYWQDKIMDNDYIATRDQWLLFIYYTHIILWQISSVLFLYCLYFWNIIITILDTVFNRKMCNFVNPSSDAEY